MQSFCFPIIIYGIKTTRLNSISWNQLLTDFDFLIIIQARTTIKPTDGIKFTNSLQYLL